MDTTIPRRRGPIATAGRVRVTLYLDELLAEWGKHQDGGLSELVRRLLAEAQNSESGEASESTLSNLYPTELRATYQHLIDRKLRAGLTSDEERQLSGIRGQINLLDRSSDAWEARASAAAAVDQELSDLRREIEGLPTRTTNGLPSAAPVIGK